MNGSSVLAKNLSVLPSPALRSKVGDALYDKTFTLDTWAYGNITYESTKVVLCIGGLPLVKSCLRYHIYMGLK